MRPLPNSTIRVLAYKALDRDFDRTWSDWAVEMLICGYDTEYLVIVAGMIEPLGYFDMKTLTTRVLNELELDYPNKLQVVWDYVSYLIRQANVNLTEPIEVPRTI